MNSTDGTKVTMVAGLDYKTMLDGGHTYDGHFSFPTMFTGTYKNLGGQNSTASGASIDQVVSDAVAKTVNLPVPLVTTFSMMPVNSKAVSLLMTWRTTLCGTAVRVPSRMTARTTRGCSRSPPFATALTAVAICRGVMPT